MWTKARQTDTSTYFQHSLIQSLDNLPYTIEIPKNQIGFWLNLSQNSSFWIDRDDFHLLKCPSIFDFNSTCFSIAEQIINSFTIINKTAKFTLS